MTIDGKLAPDGTVVEAVIRGTVCATDVTEGGRYAMSVNAGSGYGVDYQQGCGQNGDIITFRAEGNAAQETATSFWMGGRTLDLTFEGS